VTSKRNRKRRARARSQQQGATREMEPAEAEEAEETEVEADEVETRPRGRFSSAFLATGPSPMPGLGRTIGRGVLTVAAQPALVLAAIVLVAASWFVFVALGFEGSPGRLVAALALPPISTYFDLGTGNAIYGVAPAFLVFVGVSILVRTLVVSVLTGTVVEALEDGRVSRYGVLIGLRAIPTVLAVHVLSFSIIVAGNLILPILGPGLGFLGFVAALVGGLFFLGFAPTAAVRERRPVMEELRRSARAAMLPNARHLLLCSVYFFIALPIVVGFAPGGGEITANPTLFTWTFAFLINVVHLGFLAGFAYRWIVVEDVVPEEPVRRRARPAPSARVRGRR
jgi:hypothetical protein